MNGRTEKFTILHCIRRNMQCMVPGLLKRCRQGRCARDDKVIGNYNTKLFVALLQLNTNEIKLNTFSLQPYLGGKTFDAHMKSYDTTMRENCQENCSSRFFSVVRLKRQSSFVQLKLQEI